MTGGRNLIVCCCTFIFQLVWIPSVFFSPLSLFSFQIFHITFTFVANTSLSCILLQENVIEVTLTKDADGLGFSFLMCELDPPTKDFSSLVRIKQLFPGQPAEQCGRIQEGDVLLAINGHSLKELTYPVCDQLKYEFVINNLNTVTMVMSVMNWRL